MLNGTNWQNTHSHFIGDAQLLLARCQECVAHLQLIANDSDALECLIHSLSGLAEKARHAQITCTAEFSAKLQQLLAAAYAGTRLHAEHLPVLEQCLTLLAWQLELIDLHTGQLPLDDYEQKALLDELANSRRPARGERKLIAVGHTSRGSVSQAAASE